MVEGQKILITGSTGFIGSNLVEYFCRENEVMGLDVAEPKNSTIAAEFRRVDVRDIQLLTQHVRDFQPTCILHFGARTDLNGRTVEDYDSNTTGVRNVALVARRAGGIPVIYASSRLVFAIGHQPATMWDYNPSTPYGKSKILGETILREEFGQDPWLILRPTSIWGPNFGVPYRTFFDSVARNRFFKVRGERPQKSFGYVGNSCYQVDRFLAHLLGGSGRHEAFWMADYDPIDINDWADEIAHEFGVASPRTLPRAVLKSVAKVGDVGNRLGFESPITTFRLNNLLTNMVYETRREREICGALPYSRAEGVVMTCDWLRGCVT